MKIWEGLMMRKLKKLLLSMLALLYFMCVTDVNVTAAKEVQGGLEIDLTTDKKEYLLGEEIAIKFEVKNNSGKELSNVSAEYILPEGHVVAEGFASQMAVEVLKEEEIFIFTTKSIKEVKGDKEEIVPTSAPTDTNIEKDNISKEETPLDVEDEDLSQDVKPESVIEKEESDVIGVEEEESKSSPEIKDTSATDVESNVEDKQEHEKEPESGDAGEKDAVPVVEDNTAEENSIAADKVEVDEKDTYNYWWIIIILVVLGVAVFGIVKTKKSVQAVSVLLCATIFTSPLEVSAASIREPQMETVQKTIVVEEPIFIGGEESQITVRFSYEYDEELPFYDVAINGLNTAGYIYTEEMIYDLSGSIDTNQKISVVKCVVYSDLNAEVREVSAIGIEEWVVDDLTLDLGNNYITVFVVDEEGNSVSKELKIVRGEMTTGEIEVDEVNEFNCVQVMDEEFKLIGRASSNKEISSIVCSFDSAANSDIRYAVANGTTEWIFEDLPLDIGTNYLTITAICSEGASFSTDVNVVRYSSEIELADNVVLFPASEEEEINEIGKIYDQIIGVWTEDFGTEDSFDDEWNFAVYESNPLYHRILNGEIKENDVIYIPANEYFLTGLTVVFLYTDDNCDASVEGYSADSCQVIHTTMAGYEDIFAPGQDIAISATEIDEENPVAFVYFPYAERQGSYVVQAMALTQKEENDDDVVDGRKFQYQNISEEKFSIVCGANDKDGCTIKAELDEITIFDFDGKSKTDDDRLTLSGEINMCNIKPTIGAEWHLLKSGIPDQMLSMLEYTQHNEIELSYGGEVDFADVLDTMELAYKNKQNLGLNLFGKDFGEFEVSGVDTSGKIYLFTMGFNLASKRPCIVKRLGEKVEAKPLLVFNVFLTVEGKIEAKAYVTMETDTYYKGGVNFQRDSYVGEYGSIEENQGMTNIPMQINGNKYQLNVYDVKGKSKEQMEEAPGWELELGIEGSASVVAGLGGGIGFYMFGLMPISVDLVVDFNNKLEGNGNIALGNDGSNGGLAFDMWGKKVYASAEGDFELSSRLALKSVAAMTLKMSKQTYKDETDLEGENGIIFGLDYNFPLVDYTLAEVVLGSHLMGGIVYDDITQLPISGAKVTLQRHSGTGTSKKYETLTDEEGKFSLDNIWSFSDTRYNLCITKEKYDDYIMENVTLNDLAENSRDYYLNSSLKYIHVKGEVCVAGTDSSINGATVTYQGIDGTDTEGVIKRVVTDANGQFDMGYLREGPYDVTIVRVGYITKQVSITVSEDSAYLYTFVLEKNVAKVSGYVFGRRNGGTEYPVADAQVTIFRSIEGKTESYSVLTGENGYYEFVEVLKSGEIDSGVGVYTQKVEATGYREYLKEIVIVEDTENEIRLWGDERIELQDCVVSLSETNFIYDGIPKEPMVTVEVSDNILDEDDYTVSYENNIEAGTASVIIIANPMSNYIKGSTTIDFKIKGIVNLRDIKFLSICGTAISESGDLFTWGWNKYGQLGDGTLEDKNEPVKVLENVKLIDGRSNFWKAAITEDNTLYMWGSDYSVTIGTSPVKMLEHVTQVSCGNAHTGAITEDGSLYVWGWNTWGQVGDGTTEYRSQPVKVLENVIKVDCNSAYNTGALTQDGSLYMWGFNKYGQIGDGTTNSSSLPIKVLDNVKDFWISQYVSYALLEDGSLYNWGYEIGYTPQKVLERVVTISRSTGDTFAGAITEDGSLYMWGNNTYGQLGFGYRNSSENTPRKVLDDVVQVECFYYWYTGAITEDGSLYMWGNNEFGQLGDGTKINKYTPCKVLDDVVDVSGGPRNVVATLKNGDIYVWGDNECGQLGIGSYENVETPILFRLYQ